MVKYLIFLCLIITPLFGDSIIYYEAATKFIVEDVHGRKSIAKMKEDFGDRNWQILTVKRGEGYLIEAGILRVKNQAEKDAVKAIQDRKNLIRERMVKNAKDQAIAELTAEGKI